MISAVDSNSKEANSKHLRSCNDDVN